MPGRGGGGHEHTPKAKRMEEHIEESAKKEGRYKGREEEVAWRTIHKELPKKEREGEGDEPPGEESEEEEPDE